MKKFLTFCICLILTLFVIDDKFLDGNIYSNIDNLFNKKTYNIISNVNALNKSPYLNKDFSSYAKTTTNFYPKNKEDLLNIYYTILNNGWDNFSYYCDSSYTSCLDDINNLSKDSNVFSSINQLVHPYNSFKTIQSNYNSNGRIDVTIEKKYSNEDIVKINNEINNIINELNINNYTNVLDKIKVFHDYIANNNKYDKDKLSGNSKYNSDSAIGTLFEGYSICSGYTDTLAIFLSKIGIDNVRVANNSHTWNALLINNEWKHIDLTWDDPITTNNSDVIIYDYYLISSKDITKKNEKEHYYSINVYNFLK